MKRLFGGLVFLAACGSVPDNTHPPDAPHEDAAPPTDGPDIDAAPPAPRCDPSKPFNAPTRVDALDTGSNEGDAFVSTDELTVLFTSDRPGGLGLGDIYIATRATPTATWGTPSLLAGVNTSAGSETRPTMTSDELTLFAGVRPNQNSPLVVARATRANVTSPFSSLTAVTGINDGGGDNGEPFILPTQTALYFSSTRGTAGTADIYVANGISGSFQTPAVAAGTMLATASNEGTPTLTPDQLTMYFRSDRGQSMDVWFATRTSAANGFGAPVNAAALNSNLPEVPTWISADNCIIYFSRNVGQAAPNNEIYMAAKSL